MPATTRPDAFDVACPPELREREHRLIARRRQAAKVDADAARVGFALSGGGIRSATFCLGVFQALARLKLLGRIDYISTVSGGGYFGLFLGRLFTRHYVSDVADAEKMLLGSPPAGPAPSSDEGGAPPECRHPPDVFRWLRENGRYLSPRGAGDLLLGAAVLMRNWVAVQVVLASLVLMVFLTAQLLRAVAEVNFPAFMTWANDVLGCHMPGGQTWLWWSPYVLVVLAAFALWAVPVGWAYWMLVPKVKMAEVRWSLDPAWGLGMALLIGFTGVLLLPEEHAILRALSAEALLGGLLAALWSEGARRVAGAEAARRQMTRSSPERSLFEDSHARHWISSQLRRAMVWTGAAAALALVDSIGQTAYAVVVGPDSSLGAWATAVFGILVGAAASARQVVVLFGGTGTSKRPRVPVSLLAAAAAFVIMTLVLGTLDGFSHALAWDFAAPAGRPAALGKAEAPQILTARSVLIAPSETGEGWTARTQAAHSSTPECADCLPTASRSGRGDLVAPLLAWAIVLAFSVAFGRSWPFLNWSSEHPLYSARLTRAYLGASNPCRSGPSGAVTHVIPEDDIDLVHYWASPAPSGRSGSAYDKGAPIHLLNVTINETVDGVSQIEQQDRKGVGMALGPAGVSVGVRHHAVFADAEPQGKVPRPVVIYPEAKEGSYRVFEYQQRELKAEVLSLGQWVGISGAAFSTGLGARTSLGLSLLAGFGNIRLGYWWNSGTDVQRRPSARPRSLGARAARWLREAFRMQSFFLQEFLARFPGTARQHWYLSDGGHFENMGAYELIRRRLPVIVVVDAEADGDYLFEGLANLVRKARLDFQAEVRFLDDDELEQRIDPRLRRHFGSLQNLRRGQWEKSLVPDSGDSQERRERYVLRAPEQTGLSTARAALAEVRYEDRPEAESWLLYIKPTLMGDEPADIVQYHANHPAFPQETTADQFFDEAQWESYRKLGEWIAGALFASTPGGEPGRFVPGLFGLSPARRKRPPTSARRGRRAAGPKTPDGS